VQTKVFSMSYWLFPIYNSFRDASLKMHLNLTLQ